MKKGFTLIELLVVIAIISVLAVVAVPTFIDIFEDSKKGTFITDVRSIYKAAEIDWQMDNATGNRVTEYNNVTAKVEADISENYVYCVKMNGYGEVKKIVVDNGNYHIESSAKINEISKEEISESTGVAICTP